MNKSLKKQKSAAEYWKGRYYAFKRDVESTRRTIRFNYKKIDEILKNLIARG